MFFQKKPVFDYLIAGLGNPGAQYENTRHNVGFMALDRLAREHGAAVTRLREKALTGEAQIGENRVLLAKPQTFMNLSGESVSALSKFYKIPPERVLILLDDIALPVGKIRIRAKGSSGGHNGLKNIALYLGEDYPRIRIGVGAKPSPEYDLAKWVLGSFPKADHKALEESLARAAAAAELIAGGGIREAMNRYNG